MASLTQRAGVLGTRLAAHLLRRSTYHITKARIEAFALKTAEEAVDELFLFPAYHQPNGPVSYQNGVAWVTEVPMPDPPNDGGLSTGQGRNAAYAWWMNELFQDTSIRGRLANFHKSIWTAGRIQNGITGYNYYKLLMTYATGDLKSLALKMVLDIDMLYYLDNRSNRVGSPNENFAREFLELFTILKGSQIGVDDYTNYTEADISEAARVLTGFYAAKNTTYYNNLDPDTGLVRGLVRFNRHDTGNKTFSHAFNNQTITGAVDETDAYRELDDFVSMVFNQQETARAYCRRLYLYFVNDTISPEVESDIIEPLATDLYNDNYDLTAILKRLLKSVHFYDEDDNNSGDEIIGAKMKSPLMLHLQTFSYLEMGDLIPDPVNDLSNFWNRFWSSSIIKQNMNKMGQGEFPLTVEGFAGYFKTPDVSRNWFDASTIAPRYLLMRYLMNGKRVSSNSNLSGDSSFQPNVYELVENRFTDQNVVDELVVQVLETLLPELPEGYDTPTDTSKRYNYFREALMGGLSVTNWYFEWQNSQAGDTDALDSATVALERLFDVVMSSPEYQTF